MQGPPGLQLLQGATCWDGLFSTAAVLELLLWATKSNISVIAILVFHEFPVCKFMCCVSSFTEGVDRGYAQTPLR